MFWLWFSPYFLQVVDSVVVVGLVVVLVGLVVVVDLLLVDDGRSGDGCGRLWWRCSAIYQQPPEPLIWHQDQSAKTLFGADMCTAIRTSPNNVLVFITLLLSPPWWGVHCSWELYWLSDIKLLLSWFMIWEDTHTHSTHLPASLTIHTCPQSSISSLYFNPSSPDNGHQILTDLR